MLCVRLQGVIVGLKVAAYGFSVQVRAGIYYRGLILRVGFFMWPIMP